jgi:hypothetical protein
VEVSIGSLSVKQYNLELPYCRLGHSLDVVEDRNCGSPIGSLLVKQYNLELPCCRLGHSLDVVEDRSCGSHHWLILSEVM